MSTYDPIFEIAPRPSSLEERIATAFEKIEVLESTTEFLTSEWGVAKEKRLSNLEASRMAQVDFNNRIAEHIAAMDKKLEKSIAELKEELRDMRVR